MGCTTIEERRVMVNAKGNGMTMDQIARIFKIFQQEVSKWINRVRKAQGRN